MSSSAAKQRSGKSSGNPASSEKGAHSNQPDDVAKKQPPPPPPPPPQAHSKGSKGGSPPSGGGKAASSCSCGAILNFLLSATFLAAAAVSGYYVHHLLGEVSQISQRQESFTKQREELTRSLEGAVQKVVGEDNKQTFLPRGASSAAFSRLPSGSLWGRGGEPEAAHHMSPFVFYLIVRNYAAMVRLA